MGARGQKRSFRNPTIAQQARAIHDHFKELRASQVDAVVINGETLRERLTRDKEQRQAGGKEVKFSGAYYTSLREQYSKGGQNDDNFQVKQKAQEVHEDLDKGLRRLRTCNDKALLVKYLTSTTSCNQKELVGLCRQMRYARRLGRPRRLGSAWNSGRCSGAWGSSKRILMRWR